VAPPSVRQIENAGEGNDSSGSVSLDTHAKRGLSTTQWTTVESVVMPYFVQECVSSEIWLVDNEYASVPFITYPMVDYRSTIMVSIRR
jgi:hypothetical protein